MMRSVYSSLVDALLDALDGARSGVVRFESGKVRKQVVLKDGFVSFAESNHQEEHLTRILIDSGCLQKADLAKIAAAMKEGKSSDDAVLSTTGLPTTVVGEAVRVQAIGITASLLQHEAPAFRFYKFESCPHRTVQLRLPVGELIVQAARRAVTLRLLPARYRELRGVLKTLPEKSGSRLSLPIDGPEAFAFAELHQHPSLESFRSSFPDLGVPPIELVQRLLLLGLVRLETTEATGPASHESETPLAIELEVGTLLEHQEGASHYEVLGVPPDAPDERIRAAYHDLARRYHPDRFQTAAHTDVFRESVDRLFARITGAYSTLADPSARSHYDTELRRKQDGLQAKIDVRSEEVVKKERMVEALLRVGGSALASSDFEKAVEMFKECVWLQPEAAKHHLYLGLAQLEIPRRRKDAEQSLLEAIKREPLLSSAHVALARLYVKVNLPKRAEARLLELLKWDPANREARNLLASLEQGLG
jgi:curved DNA-binding protein CbpA